VPRSIWNGAAAVAQGAGAPPDIMEALEASLDKVRADK
jgi:hypothetical protein